MDNSKLIEDAAHWQNLTPPLAPNEKEVRMYEERCKGYGPVCMLGMTKQLVHICDFMVDLNPIPQGKPVVKSDWFGFKNISGVVIGDGVLNLCGLSLVESLLPKCERIVCRVFLKKMNGMKYANIFPTDFPGAKEVIETQKDVAIVVWDS